MATSSPTLSMSSSATATSLTTSHYAMSSSTSMERTKSSTSASTSVIGATRRKCETKEALCRAMGTLFLQHRVDKLQGDVDQLQHRKEEGGSSRKDKCSWGGGWKGGCRSKNALNGQGGRRSPPSTNAESNGLFGAGKSSPKSSSSTSNTKHEGSTNAKKIVVADVSLLIYSLRTIHNWLKEGDCRVVIPMEALRTLDVLKKGDHYLNLVARKATRFLDERFGCESLGTDTTASFAPGLVAQKASEKVTCAEWKSMELTVLDNDGRRQDASDDELRRMSNSVRETLACSLFFLRELVMFPASQDKMEGNLERLPQFCLALALPPPHFDCSEDVRGVNAQWIKYGQRADGNALLQYAKHLRMGDATLGDRLIVAPTAASWLTADGISKECR
ncbi:hypothetical protein CBS101457_000961 [Exobasidium rhododendri]|nr:hypothetical protein CBS101457_000961 [Exobasidium rhododendri]